MTTALENTQHIIVDFYRNSYTYINAKQGDVGTRHLIVTFTNDGIEFPLDSTTMKCDFKMQKPDNHVIYNPVEILEDGTVHIEFKDNYLCVAGIANAELIVTEVETKNILSTMAFHINILTAVENEIIESTDEFGSLEKDIKALHKALDDVEVVNENEEIRQSSEDARQSNEETRQNNEKIRETNEINRKSSETNRESAESSRTFAETTRETNESARQNAEVNRTSAENTRNTAETTRINNETERVNKENIRITNENIRIENENLRKNEEVTRIKNETDRQIVEATRNENEIKRETSEDKRITAENARENSEIERNTTWTKLNEDINSELEKTQNLNLEELVSTDSYKVVITKKDGTQVFSPNLLNKISIGEIDTIMFGETATASLSGEFGEQKLNISVPCGKPFTITNTYASVEEMNADIDNISEYDFVIINSDKASDDQGKLYIKENNLLRYVMTMGSSALSEETIIGALGYDPKNLKITTVIESNSSSTSLENSVDGKIKLEKLIADSYQKHLSGKNFLDNVGVTLTDCGITFTVNSDKSIATKGTSTDVAGFLIVEGMSIPSGKYRLSGCPLDGSELSYYMLVILNDGASDDDWKYDFGDGVEIELTDNDVVNCMIIIGSDQTIDKTFYPMITLASETDQTYEPYCGGTASPNPSFPQNIHSTGDSGWFDGEWVQGVRDVDSGLFTSNQANFICNAHAIPCESGDVIEFSTESSYRGLYVMYFNNGKYIKADQIVSDNLVSELISTTPNNATEFYVQIFSIGITPQTVGKVAVTINGQYAVIVDEVGKNFQPSIVDSTSINGVSFTLNGDDSITSDGTATADTYLVLPNITLEAGEYIMSSGATDGGWSKYIYYFSVDGTYYYDDNGADKEFVLAGKTTLSPKILIRSGVAIQTTFYPMIRPKGTSGTFAPYQHNRTYIPISEPLRAVNDVKDEICVQNGEYGVRRRVGEVIFDGSDDENWVYNDTYFYSPLLSNSNADIDVAPLCSHFNGVDINTSIMVADNTIGIRTDFVAINCSKFTNIDDFKTWLGGNPISVQYKAKEPVFTPFTDQTPFYNLLSYDDVTHVSIVGLHENVEPTLTMRFPRNEDGALVMDGWSKGNLASIKVEKNNSITDDEIIAIFNEVFG